MQGESQGPEPQAVPAERRCANCGQVSDPIIRLSLVGYRLAGQRGQGKKFSLGLGHLCRGCFLEHVAVFKKNEAARRMIDD
jgi:hypothetical protein